MTVKGGWVGDGMVSYNKLLEKGLLYLKDIIKSSFRIGI